MFERIKREMTPAAMDRIVGKVAAQTLQSVVSKTPRKWFGQVRRSWGIETPKQGMRYVQNGNKIMFWIEEGTKAHGPVRAKALFIPLTRKAVLAHASNRGFEPKNVAVKGDSNWVGETRKGLRVFTSRGRAVTLIYGVDYVLAKRVKGIAAMKIAAGEQNLVEGRLTAEISNAVVKILTNG